MGRKKMRDDYAIDEAKVRCIFESRLDYTVSYSRSEKHANGVRGIDLYYDDSFFARLDIEIKRSWDCDRFPHDSLRVPYRKLLKASSGVRTIFCIMNKSLSRCILIDAEDVNYSPKREYKGADGNVEVYQQVPINQGYMLKVD